MSPKSVPHAVLGPAGNSTAEETCTTAACRQLRIKDVREKVTPKEIAEAPLVGRVPYDTFPARSAGPDGPLPKFPGRFMQSLTKPSGTPWHSTASAVPALSASRRPPGSGWRCSGPGSEYVARAYARVSRRGRP